MEPLALEEMAGASEWARLRTLTGRADPPNLIVAGPAGIGKSCALRLALGNTISLWLRCSQDPTLRDNRDRVKAAARRRGDTTTWIILEHADLLHTDAQTFLRRVIETSVGTARFVLEVRDLAAIAEPLLSRTVLFNAPTLLPHEVRAEVLRRTPALPLATATRIAEQANGNVRWATLQGIGGSDGFLMEGLTEPTAVRTWADLLRVMEQLQESGSNPRAWVADGRAAWDRPGGACPWALTAAAVAARF
jgi:hypothetical protein